MRLYWRPGTASMAPHAALAEIGVEYELVEIDRETAQADPGYRALNPTGVVPTLVDGNLVLSESVAILLYLVDRFPDARLAPDGDERAQLYRWLIFMTNSRFKRRCSAFFYPERYGDASVSAAASAEAARSFDLPDRELDGRTWLRRRTPTAADLLPVHARQVGRRLEYPLPGDRTGLREYPAHARIAGRPPHGGRARSRDTRLGSLDAG